MPRRVRAFRPEAHQIRAFVFASNRWMLLGSSSAQSVILMVIVITLTAFQFKYIERRVHYG